MVAASRVVFGGVGEMTTFCMWLMFFHGLTVGGTVVMALMNSSFIRWWMLALAAMAVFNAATLELPRDPLPEPFPRVPAMEVRK